MGKDQVWAKKEELSEVGIEVFSDSNLLVQSLNLGWKRKANLDLWGEMDEARGWLNIKWTWVKSSLYKQIQQPCR